MKHTLAVLILAGFAVFAALGGARADVVVLLDDDFNSENGGFGVLNYTGFANWEVLATDGTVDLIGNGFWDFFPENGLYVDMDGSTGNAGLMTAYHLLEPGDYTLTFDLAGNQRDNASETVVLQVGLGSVFDETFTLSQTALFTTYTRTFTVGEEKTAALSFEGTGADNVGMLLDNVKLEMEPAGGGINVIPAPPALLLGAIGVGLVAAVRRRRSRG